MRACQGGSSHQPWLSAPQEDPAPSQVSAQGLRPQCPRVPSTSQPTKWCQPLEGALHQPESQPRGSGPSAPGSPGLPPRWCPPNSPVLRAQTGLWASPQCLEVSAQGGGPGIPETLGWDPAGAGGSLSCPAHLHAGPALTQGSLASPRHRLTSAPTHPGLPHWLTWAHPGRPRLTFAESWLTLGSLRQDPG